MMGAWDLRSLAGEASLALARLDADRLEELAVCCASFDRGLEGRDGSRPEAIIRQARDASHGMRVFAGVLEATRANLAVVNRLRSSAEAGYAARPGSGSAERGTREEIDGNH